MDLKLEDFETFYDPATLQARVAELGAEITRDLASCDDVVVIGVLKGAFVFMADLVRHLPPHYTCDFLRLSSYEGTQSTGTVRFDFDMTQPITGKHVLIVEDIVDTGGTMDFLLRTLKERKPASLRVCTLLHKPARSKVEVPIDYCGFVIPNRFVIGYGLDLEGRFRCMDHIAALKPEIEATL